MKADRISDPERSADPTAEAVRFLALVLLEVAVALVPLAYAAAGGGR